MKESYENLTEMWGNCEEILYLISNKSGELPRSGIKKFAKPISGRIENLLNTGSVNLETKEDVINLVKEVQIYRDTEEEDRYFGINFSNIDSIFGKNTVEFRLPNGTLDADTWIQNINLFGGIIKTCQDLALMQTKEELSDEEKNKLDVFGKLKEAKDINEKLELLLLLVIPEENRHIYEERFETNYKLMKENMEMEAVITSKTAVNPINLKKYKKKDIIETIFTGIDQVTGMDYEYGESFCKNDLEENERDYSK